MHIRTAERVELAHKRQGSEYSLREIPVFDYTQTGVLLSFSFGEPRPNQKTLQKSIHFMRYFFIRVADLYVIAVKLSLRLQK